MSAPLVIVATSGTSGDMLPYIALAQGLRDRGHRVLMLIPGFQEGFMDKTGLPYRTFGTRAEGQALLADPALWDERKGWKIIWGGMAPHLGVLRRIIQDLPATEECVLLAHPILLPMAAIARSARPQLRIVTAYLAPSNLCSNFDLTSIGSLRIPTWLPQSWSRFVWSLVHRWMNAITLPSLNRVRAQNGLAPVPHFFRHMLETPNASVGLFPAWFGPKQADWPERYAEGDFLLGGQAQAQLAPELEAFLSAGDAPIVFTPGTGHQHAADYFRTALAALQRLGRRGLFITPHRAQVPEHLPPGVMWQDHAPFPALLPRAAAVVHHGGIGTTAEAMRAGIPQLVVPFAYDQFDNGWRVKRLGVGGIVLAKRLSARRLHKSLAHLLTAQDVAAACKRIAHTMRQAPGLEGVLDQLEPALLGERLAARTADCAMTAS